VLQKALQGRYEGATEGRACHTKAAKEAKNLPLTRKKENQNDLQTTANSRK
jgi:hypothetical protein